MNNNQKPTCCQKCDYSEIRGEPEGRQDLFCLLKEKHVSEIKPSVDRHLPLWCPLHRVGS